jgi:ComF family protein
MTDLKQIGSRIVRGLIEAVFPAKCPVCGNFFHKPQHYDVSKQDIRNLDFEQVMAPFLCPQCLSGFSPIESLDYGEDSSQQFRKSRSFGNYKEKGEKTVLAKAIRCFKYNEKMYLAKPLEQLLFSVFVRYWEKGEIDLVMPVPLHIRRFRERGFNQAYLLIRNWHRMAETFHIGSDFRIERDVLFRSRWTEPQAKLTGISREENVKGAFSVINCPKIKGKKILLIDDIHTTGATVNECAKVLLHGGAEYADVLTLAR